MHVLTKIFIGLVSLLSVLLVPLVVVYSSNEDSFKAKYQGAESTRIAAISDLNAANIAHGNELTRRDLDLQQVRSANDELRRKLADQTASLEQLRFRLAQATSLQAEKEAHLSVLVESVKAGQMLNESLVVENRSVRGELLGTAQRNLDLDERNRDLTAQLEVAIYARLAMEEEVQQLKDDVATAINTNAAYIARFGRLEMLDPDGAIVPALVQVDATVINVRRGEGRVLAEINAGSRDGVEEGWLMNIRRGGEFLGNLRILEVDINRATGQIEMEDALTRGEVQPGDRVITRPISMERASR